MTTIFFGKNSLKLLVLFSIVLTCHANALLPNPTTPPIALNVLQTTPPPLLNESQTQIPIPTQQGLASAVYAFVVRSDDMNGETLIPLHAGINIQKGDMLEYQAHYTNYTGERIRRTSVSLTIPKELELVGGIMPLQVAGSVNGSRFGRMPLRGSIGGVIQEIPFKHYKALRWTIEDIGLNGTAVVKYRAVLK